MKTDNAPSAASSARTSGDDDRAKRLDEDLRNDPQARPNEDRPQPLHPESSEADFLTLQQEHAKKAIARAAAEIKDALAQGVDPGAWMKQYPWATLGASAVAGFVATAMLVPSKEQQALKKLAAIERALNPPPPRRHEPDDVGSVDGKQGAHDYKSGRSGMLTSIMGEVIGAIKPALISLLTSGVTASAVKPSPEEMQAAAQAGSQAGAGAGAAAGADAGASAS
jgi:hypothetical protein